MCYPSYNGHYCALLLWCDAYAAAHLVKLMVHAQANTSMISCLYNMCDSTQDSLAGVLCSLYHVHQLIHGVLIIVLGCHHVASYLHGGRTWMTYDYTMAA